MSDHSALTGLSKHLGIAPEWTDISGQTHHPGIDTLRSLIRAHGLDAETEKQAEATLADLKAHNSTLPPHIIVEPEASLHLEAASNRSWRLRLEHGDVIEGMGREILPTCPLGLHRLKIGPETCPVICAPQTAPSVLDVTGQERLWGVTGSLYGLHGGKTGDVGSYADLAVIAEALAGHGAAFYGINPIHARGWTSGHFSPYSPSSRVALEPQHLSIEAVDGYREALSQTTGTHQKARQVGDGSFIDYAQNRAALDPLLRAAFDHADRSDFRRWQEGDGQAVYDFALFEAISHRFGSNWKAWPDDLQKIKSLEVDAFRADHKAEVDYAHWLQFQAERQLSQAQDRALSAGMAFGLYLDLAVGVRLDGADVWSMPEAFAHGVSIGAPPDAFAPDGQNWNLAPFSPLGLRTLHYKPFQEILRAMLRASKLLRIDHVLGFARMFWVPLDGTPGSYVRYPLNALLAITRLEAHRHGAVIIGEDLGSVPPDFRSKLDASGLYGCAVMQFERHYETPDQPFKAPSDYRERALASFATHDTATLRGWMTGFDIKARAKAGQLPETAVEGALSARHLDVTALHSSLFGEAPSKGALRPQADHIHGALAKSASALVSLQLDDILEVEAQHNLPGTVDNYPNWRLRHPIKVEDLATDPRLVRTGQIMQEGRTRKL